MFFNIVQKTLSEEIPECIKVDNEGNYVYSNLRFDGNNELTFEKIDLTNDAKVKLVDFKPLIDSEIYDNSVKAIPLKLQSTFETAKTVDGTDQTIDKTIETQFTINVPEVINKNLVNNPLLQKTISVDGNMFVNSELTVNGDLFNQGNSNGDLTDSVYDKYNSGIFVNVEPDEAKKSGTESGEKSEIKVNFNGNVVTYGTLNIKQHSDVTVSNGNLYANNVNLGRLKSEDHNILSNTLNVKNDMIVDNDFTYNCKSTGVTINNLYAINEYNDPQQDENKKPKSSSSLIINSDMQENNSFINIKKDAYIIGSAYINTKGDNGKYQTGESISVKGNYSAYTSPITDDRYNYELNYYEPLQLVDTKVDKQDGTKSSMDFNDKASYFFKAANADKTGINTGEEGKIQLSGDINDNIYISGAYLNNGEIKQAIPFSDVKQGIVDNKRREFANQVYEAGDYNENGDSTALMRAYNNRTVEKNVSNLINLNASDEIKEEKDGYIAVVHKKESGSDSTLKLGSSDSNGCIDINNKSGIIVTDADIEFMDDNINFHGTIITTGNVVTSGGSVNLTYSGDAVQKVIRDYKLQNIFITEKSMDFQMSSVESASGENIAANKFVDNNYWKIVK